MVHPRLVVACLLATLLASASFAWAEDPPATKGGAKQKAPTWLIGIAGRLDPTDLLPGASGKLVVGFKPGTFKVEDINFKWEPIAAVGVTYDKPKAVLSKTDFEWTDEWDDLHKYWKHNFKLIVPLALAKSVAPGTEVGVKITYTACTTEACGPERVVEVRIPVGKAASGAKPAVSAPVEQEEGAVSAKLSKGGKALIIRFEPSFGWHFYLPGSDGAGQAITVAPKAAEGVTWGKVTIPTGDKLEEPLEVRIPFTRANDAKLIEVDVTWAGCSDLGQCLPQRTATFGVAYAPDASAAIVRAPDQPKVARGDVAFPVIDTDDVGTVEDEGDIAALIKEKGLAVVLGILFLIGAGLAFTPCVFPIIPLVVATIGGGGDVPKRRLTILLATYVFGLCMAFSTLGLVAALGGGSMSAAFSYPAVQWGFAIFFILLAFGMLGLFELQPPQWIMKLQGGAQNRSGSVIGAFLLGVLGAVLASPCTGPVIAGLVLFTAKTGDAGLGFSLFFVLGLGMGVVFFAFGSLNFALRPGPWMVWVRYVFGMLLFGGAIYYLGLGELARGWSVAAAVVCCVAFAVLAIKAQHAKHSEEKARGRKVRYAMLLGFVVVAGLAYAGFMPAQVQTSSIDLLLVGLAIALASAFALYWHLHSLEGEMAPVARKRAISVGIMYAAVLGLGAFLTWPPDAKINWTKVRTRTELVAAVNQATADGKPVLVDFWATTCYYCKKYDKVFASDKELLAKFDEIVPIKVDLTKGELPAVRGALGVPPEMRPVLVFIDRQGRIRRRADVLAIWLGKGADDEIKASAQGIHTRLDLILDEDGSEAGAEVGQKSK